MPASMTCNFAKLISSFPVDRADYGHFNPKAIPRSLRLKMTLLLLILVLMLLGFLVWWLFIETEGAYLGRRVVVALYDIYAGRYDRVKQFDRRADIMLLSQPLLRRLHPRSDPLILDVATGTGRFPLALAADARFEGHVIGIDLSRKMLDVAAERVAAEHFESFITLARQDAMHLPFPDTTFDAVTCLEALEFLPDPERALEEMVRVLRPGGVLLATIRIDTRWMPGRTPNESEMRALLESMGVAQIDVEVWQSDYSKVWALKAGAADPVGSANLGQVLTNLSEVTIKGDAQV